VPPRTQAERIAALEERVRELRADVDELAREIRGPGTPDEPPIRRRLHRLERSGEEALKIERELRRRAQDAAAVSGRQFSRREKLAALAIAALVALTPYVLLFVPHPG
jgi:predicted RNase H-like nuclease (RuvC/YqgF family)